MQTTMRLRSSSLGTKDRETIKRRSKKPSNNTQSTQNASKEPPSTSYSVSASDAVMCTQIVKIVTTRAVSAVIMERPQSITVALVLYDRLYPFINGLSSEL